MNKNYDTKSFVILSPSPVILNEVKNLTGSRVNSAPPRDGSVRISAEKNLRDSSARACTERSERGLRVTGEELRIALLLAAFILASPRLLFAEDEAGSSSSSLGSSKSSTVLVSGQVRARSPIHSGTFIGTSISAAPLRTLLASEEQKPKVEVQVETKTLSGTISAGGPNGITVRYQKNEKDQYSSEMWFPYERELELTGYDAKAAIQVGDLVTATYDEAEDGTKRLLKGITLDRKKSEDKRPESSEASKGALVEMEIL